MTRDDAPDQSPAVDERKTRELCGAERDGLKCMLPKGHAHEHESFRAAQPVSWSA